jgi:protein O-GlcNAc transferase
MILSNFGEFDKAKAHMREALRLEPEAFNARVHLGWLCLHQGELDEAAQYLAEETKKSPNSAYAFYLLGMVRVQQQNWTEACACFRQACALQPGVPRYQNELAKALREVGERTGGGENKQKQPAPELP